MILDIAIFKTMAPGANIFTNFYFVYKLIVVCNMLEINLWTTFNYNEILDF